MDRNNRIAYNFKRLRNLKGWTIEETAVKGNVGRNYVSQIESTKTITSWGPDSEAKWKAVFDVDISEFYRPPDDKSVPAIFKKGRNIPVISWVQAGEWNAAIEINHGGENTEWIPSTCEDPRAFGLYVRGDSMEPEFKEGEIIQVNPNIDINSGDYVIAKRGEDAVFKKFKHYVRYGRNVYELHSLNPAYKPITIEEGDKDFRLIGKMFAKYVKY